MNRLSSRALPVFAALLLVSLTGVAIFLAFNLLSRWLLGGAIYLTGWYYEGPALQAAQMGAISLLLMAGFFSLLSGDTLRIRPSLVEWLFSAAFLFAMLVALVVLTLMMVFWRLPLVQQQTREEQARVADLALANMEQGLDNTQALMSTLTGLADSAGGPAAAVAADIFAVATRQLLVGDNLLDGVYLHQFEDAAIGGVGRRPVGLRRFTDIGASELNNVQLLASSPTHIGEVAQQPPGREFGVARRWQVGRSGADAFGADGAGQESCRWQAALHSCPRDR